MRALRLQGAGIVVTAAACVIALGGPFGGGRAGLGGDRFSVPSDATELVVVSSPSYHPPGSIATLQAYERAGRHSPWRAVTPKWQAEIGVSGFYNVRREGDGSTPTGTFRIGRRMYGNDPNPGGLHDAYTRLVCGDWWDEDPYSAHYNELVHVPCGTTPSFAAWSEALWTETVAYPYFAVLETNNNPIVRGADAPGSGIFLHAWIGEPTEGCVALPLPELLLVLRWLRPSAHPVIEMGTTSEVGTRA